MCWSMICPGMIFRTRIKLVFVWKVHARKTCIAHLRIMMQYNFVPGKLLMERELLRSRKADLERTLEGTEGCMPSKVQRKYNADLLRFMIKMDETCDMSVACVVHASFCSVARSRYPFIFCSPAP